MGLKLYDLTYLFKWAVKVIEPRRVRALRFRTRITWRLAEEFHPCLESLDSSQLARKEGANCELQVVLENVERRASVVFLQTVLDKDPWKAAALTCCQSY